VDAPEFYAVIDRTRAAQFGWSANSIATKPESEAWPRQCRSTQFLDGPSTGTPYFLAVQTPEHRIRSIDDLKNTPVGSFARPTHAG